MAQATKSDTVSFSAKGQLVIPRWLRTEYGIEEGTKASVMSTPEGILLKPVTAVTIRRLRGILKRKPGEKSFAEQWAAHKREEIALEDAKYARNTGGAR